MAKKPVKKRSTKPRTGTATSAAAAENEPSAQFVFRGTLLQRGAATFPEVPVDENTAVVQVDEIVQGPASVGDYAGQPITVQLKAGGKASEGQQYVFHTNGWMFGSGLAVVCEKFTAAKEVTVQKLHAAVSARPARALKARSDRAEMIVEGEVTQVRQVPRDPDAPISEHDPEWQEAVVRVDHVARGAGRKSVKEVVVRFAASPDVKWVAAPKFSVGTEGVWMLGDKRREHAALRAAAGVPKSSYLVLDPEDFHPKEEAAQVLSQIE